MEDVYDMLVTIEYPDAITGGLRRATDALRAVVERSRADVTTTVLQTTLQRAIEQRLGPHRHVGPVRVGDLTTPALLVDATVLERNLATMAAALPGARLRPHVKAHKCTALAARQAAHGHRRFTCATTVEAEGLARAGLGQDLLLANEVVDVDRLGRLARSGTRVTVAVDSEETVAAAAAAGIGEVVVDVNVGLPRCGCAPERAGRLAEFARARGLIVRGVMGYEGHVVGVRGQGTTGGDGRDRHGAAPRGPPRRRGRAHLRRGDRDL